MIIVRILCLPLQIVWILFKFTFTIAFGGLMMVAAMIANLTRRA